MLKLNQISPLSGDLLYTFFGERKPLLVLEDALGAGCVGQRVAAILTEGGLSPSRLILKNMEKHFAPEGSVAELNHRFGLDAAGVAAAVQEAIGHGQ